LNFLEQLSFFPVFNFVASVCLNHALSDLECFIDDLVDIDMLLDVNQESSDFGQLLVLSVVVKRIYRHSVIQIEVERA
jgi:hypothetical protein